MKYEITGGSHGPALEIALEGVPQGLALCSQDFETDLARRRNGYGRSKRQAVEQDCVSIISGVQEGISTGEPLLLTIPNQARDHQQQCSVPRPGHADMWGALASRTTNCTPTAELASARETAGRVAAGVVAKKFLNEFGVKLGSLTLSIGDSSWRLPSELSPELLDTLHAQAEESPVGCPDSQASKDMQRLIDECAQKGDSCGGSILLFALGLLPALGGCRPAADRLTARIGSALFSIPTMRSVAFVDEPKKLTLLGSKFHDSYENRDGKLIRSGNTSCGIEGGMTTGEPLLITLQTKPLSTCTPGLSSFDLASHVVTTAPSPRADTCVVPAVGVIAEAELALCLVTAYQQLSSLNTMESILASYQEQLSYINQQLTITAGD